MKKIISMKYQKKAISLLEKIHQQPIAFRTIFFNECLKLIEMNVIYNYLKTSNQLELFIELVNTNIVANKRKREDVSEPQSIPIVKKQKTESVKKEIDLSFQNITDEDLKQYANYTHINLNGCETFTDIGLSYLKEVQDINLKGCNQITDKGIANLPETVTKINISNCKKITNDGLATCKNITSVSFYKSKNVNLGIIDRLKSLKEFNAFKEKEIKKLLNRPNSTIEKVNGHYTNYGLSILGKNKTNIDLSNNPYISDDGLAHLSNVTDINLEKCNQITDKGLEYLTNVKEIDLSCCKKITYKGLAHLKNVETINLSHCTQITDDGLAHLPKETLKKIYLVRCREITANGISYLKSVRDIFGLSKEVVDNVKKQERKRDVEEELINYGNRKVYKLTFSKKNNIVECL
ncbi:hypothetical protein DID75_02100 [Candidatus Marinamargulisbacteria bacterium SCGC AG-410-N11]|nr:hypothetical protein DID75_02100 [Candidatus Marinamargulisbacteria bacterium SCGC AG-410-N11]